MKNLMKTIQIDYARDGLFSHEMKKSWKTKILMKIYYFLKVYFHPIVHHIYLLIVRSLSMINDHFQL